MSHPKMLLLVANMIGLTKTQVLPRTLAQHGGCSGFDEEWDMCPDLPPCSGCKPIDCKFSAWNDWFAAGGCSGLLYRQRSILVSNNECGKPCAGPKSESMRKLLPECAPNVQDCAFSLWTEWTASCTSSTEQQYRTRTIIRSSAGGGKPCEGNQKETKPCNKQAPQTAAVSGVPCVLSEWHDWTQCTVTCGVGQKERTRRVIAEAKLMGKPCDGSLVQSTACKVMDCESKDCVVSKWSAWSLCDSEVHPQRYRSRHVLQNALGSGKRCNETLKETEGCLVSKTAAPQNCVISPWSKWQECDKSCDGGQKYRTRALQAPSAHGGLCPHTLLKMTLPCNTQPCEKKKPNDCQVSQWSEWSACSTHCGKGSHLRSRTVIEPAREGGLACEGALSEVGPCESFDCESVDCKWNEWFDWSACTCSCGGGSKRRSRHIAVAPTGAGKKCEPLDKEEVVPCNTVPCPQEEKCIDGLWAAWNDWSACSASCSSGFKSRSRRVAQEPSSCGKPAVGKRQEFAACQGLPPCVEDRDCQLSDWGDWSYCSCTCFGISERNRHIKVFSSGAGKACLDASLKQITPCNAGVGEDLPSGCGNQLPVDCVLSEWKGWTECTKECGGGQQKRERQIVTQPSHGGKPCEGELVATAPCNTAPCEAEACTDCVWGQWSEWGDCSKCGGQRYRNRAIDKLPNHCGKQCNLKSAEEVSNCTSTCKKDVFCAWADWSTTGCNGCGSTSGFRTRALGSSTTGRIKGSFLFSGDMANKCAGTQLDIYSCSLADTCKPKCVPVACKFESWAQWSAGTCTGLCERSRVIGTMNNECGTPCRGPLVTTKRCDILCHSRKDCKMSSWTTWNLDGCNKPAGQAFRSRSIEQMPELSGAPCEGPLYETKSCGGKGTVEVRDCKVASWTPWTTCTATCGGGQQTRSRTIIEHASAGGDLCDESLQEMRMCGQGSCSNPKVVDCVLSDWESWSECGGGCGGPNQRDRKRQITQLPAGGKACIGHLEETKTCGSSKVDCAVTEWTEWDVCDKTCGGGQQTRVRLISTYAENGGATCPEELMQVQGCNALPCGSQDCQVGEWTRWTDCSATCGEGQQTRTRDVLHNRGLGGTGCELDLQQTKPCLVGPGGNPTCDKSDCKWGEWSVWSACTCDCGGGQQTRNREIKTMPTGAGNPCLPEDKDEMRACNTQACETSACVDGEWDNWEKWAPCSATCGGGVTFRTRKVKTSANECGQPATGLDRERTFCNQFVSCEKDVDCLLSDWDPWTACPDPCNGIQRRSRRIKLYGRGNGTYCLGPIKESAPCHQEQDGKPLPECVKAKPVDCKLGEWKDWGICSKTCGGGEHKRSRPIAVLPSNGGKPCDGALEEVEECSRQACAGPTPVDCAYGEWEDWGACGKCSGQRKRFRHILQYPLHGGRNCDQFAHEDTGGCPRYCHQKMYCTWQSWGTWSDCTARCGEGKRSRRRWLHLSENKSTPPTPLSEITAQYDNLVRRKQALKSARLQDIAIAFGAGCVCFLVSFGTVRALTRLRPSRSGAGVDSTRPARVAGAQTYERLELEGQQDTELPLMGALSRPE